MKMLIEKKKIVLCFFPHPRPLLPKVGGEVFFEVLFTLSHWERIVSAMNRVREKE